MLSLTLDPLEKAGGEPLLDQLGHPLNFTSLSASRHRQIDSCMIVPPDRGHNAYEGLGLDVKMGLHSRWVMALAWHRVRLYSSSCFTQNVCFPSPARTTLLQHALF